MPAVVCGERALLDTSLSDEEVIQRVQAGETSLYEILMRRYNQRLYRVARSILRNDSEAEDVMQEAYVRAFEHLGDFAGEAKFSTWLTKIAVYEALRRLRRQGRLEGLDSMQESKEHKLAETGVRDPERQAYDRELRQILERSVDLLPDVYRTVSVLRLVEGLSVAETAACLEVGEETVKTRLHRARALLRRELHQRAGMVAGEIFPFHLSRCDRVVAGVFQRISAINPAAHS